jgi:putative flavoprotein involved in K+ transport
VAAFDGRAYPTHERGVTTVPGLYFLGLPWLYSWGSGRFSGIARGAGYLAEHIRRGDRAARLSDRTPPGKTGSERFETLAAGS